MSKVFSNLVFQQDNLFLPVDFTPVPPLSLVPTPSSSHTLLVGSSALYYLGPGSWGLSSLGRGLSTGLDQEKTQEMVLFSWDLLIQTILAASRRGCDFGAVLLECGALLPSPLPFPTPGWSQLF